MEKMKLTGTHFKNALHIATNGHLLVQLRTLRQIRTRYTNKNVMMRLVGETGCWWL